MTREQWYPSDLSDAEWAVVEPLLPAPTSHPRGGRRERHPRRDIVDAILYVVCTGCAWRQLPADFPPWETVYWYFTRWEQQKLTFRMVDALRSQVRAGEGREAEPSAGLMDSQSVKAADTVGIDTQGYDAGEKINGRKRFIVTDTLGLLLVVLVLPASTQDRDGARKLLLELRHRQLMARVRRVRHLFADSGFAGMLVDWARGLLKTTIEIVRKPQGQKGFAVIPRRWGGRTHAGVAHQLPAPGPRLRTPPHHRGGHDPLGRYHHHDPPHRPRTARNPTWTTPIRHHVEISNTLPASDCRSPDRQGSPSRTTGNACRWHGTSPETRSSFAERRPGSCASRSGTQPRSTCSARHCACSPRTPACRWSSGSLRRSARRC